MARGEVITDDRRKHRGGTGKRSRALSVGRLASLLAFLPVASRAPIYTQLILALIVDGRMPAGRKALLAGALGYLLVGKDLVPDEVPLIGGLDDLIVVVLAVDLFLEGVPGELLDEKLHDLGIERAAFDHDVAQIRRLTPGPVRRIIRRLPGLAEGAGRAFNETGLGPRVRAWISREESIA